MNFNRVYFFLLFLGLSFAVVAESQVSQEWIRQRSGMWAASVVLDSNGNAYVTGPSLLDASHNYKEDVITVKYDPAGNEVWVREFDETADSTYGADVPNWLTLDSSGNLIVAGYSFLIGEGNRFLILKYDSAGNLLWRARSTMGARAIRVAADAAGNIYATGATNVTASDFVTAKFDSAGNQVWLRTYNGPSDFTDYPTGLDVTPSGSVVVTGRSAGGLSGYDFATIVYNTDGSTRWIQRYSSADSGTDQPSDVLFGPDETVYVGGFEETPNNTDFSLVKYANDGTFIWVRNYNGPSDKWDSIKRIQLDSAGNILVTGYEQQPNFYSDFATIKYDPDGNQLWVQRLNLVTSGDEIPFSMAIGSNDAVYVAGESEGKFALVKYNASGLEEWHVTYDNPGNLFDRAQGVATGPSNRVVITGTSPILTVSYTETSVSQPPVAVLTANPTTGSVPLTVNFSSASSYDTDGSIVSYLWDFGDQTTSNDPNPSHVYNTAGSYTAVLRVYDNDGLTADDGELIVVNANSTLFYEDFVNEDISAWQQLRGNWSAMNQTLHGQDRRKAEIISPFAGCGNCSAEADLLLQSSGTNLSMIGWYLDAQSYVEVVLMEEKDRVVLKHHDGGTIVLKSKFATPIESGINYHLKAAFDGTSFSVYLNGNLLFTTPSSTSPLGKFGFRLKGSSGANPEIRVDNLLIQ